MAQWLDASVVNTEAGNEDNIRCVRASKMPLRAAAG